METRLEDSLKALLRTAGNFSGDVSGEAPTGLPSLREHRITHMFFVRSMLRMLLEYIQQENVSKRHTSQLVWPHGGRDDVTEVPQGARDP